jgi:pimeloyl-ACP methyl ester carboxylesterase
MRPFVAGAGAAGALALLNRRLATGLPINHLGGTGRTWRWREHAIFVTEDGSRDASDVLLVHNPAPHGSSYEYRRLFPLLARRHRVVAFDFLGCGLSDKPNLEYAADLFVDQILDALRELCDGKATVIGSSLGAAYAIRAAAQAPGLVERLVAILPTGTGGVRMGALATLMRAPVLGESLHNALASKRALRRFLRRFVYGESSSVTAEVVDAYYAVAHQPGSRFVPAAFFAGRLDCDVARDLPFVEAPLLVIWGKRAKINPARNATEYVALAKHAEAEYFVRSALLPHDEEAAAVADRIETFLAGAGLRGFP